MQKPIITRAEEGGFIAVDPKTGTTTQGETYQKALRNLQEATSLYLEIFPKKTDQRLEDSAD
jgi:predicted RNase H-like HicB family nuclease